MTPQEQHPKFYSHPHYWIDAKGLQLKCIEKHWELKDDPRSEISIGSTFIYDAEMYNSISVFGTIDKYEPLFKPQEGESFIKDLQAAVSCATESKYIYRVEKDGQHVLNTGITSYDSVVRMPILNLSLVKGYQLESGLRLSYFDTATYVDRMRELGYYL
jgi:hypothetical protein